MAQLTIAIDGPGGAGKSTIARLLAKKLSIAYLDTGAMYRGVAVFAQSNGADVSAAHEILPLLDKLDMIVEFNPEDGGQKIVINGEDVTPRIREHSVSMAASTVSKIPEVRLKMVELQRNFAAANSCVLDGRDICSYVLPSARFKFFLTASPEERAKRRHKELEAKGVSTSYKEVYDDIVARDYQDSTRTFAPLRKTADSELIDTTNKGIDEVMSIMLGHIGSEQ